MSTPVDGPLGRPEVLIAATLHLMSSFILQRGCLRLAATIQRHLALLAERDDLDPILARTCAQLRVQWAAALEAMQDAAVVRGARTLH